MVSRREAACFLLTSFAGTAFAQQYGSEARLLKMSADLADPAALNFEKLPRLSGLHSVVNAVTPGPDPAPEDKIDMQDMRLNLHSYLAYHQGRFWCMWSDGPRVEDEPTQEVRYATSLDGLSWSESRPLTGTPASPRAFIARGFWQRDGQLHALAAHFQGKGAFGAQDQKKLELVHFVLDEASQQWLPGGQVRDNTINNFPPQSLGPEGWMVTRRDSSFNVSILIGGQPTIDTWENIPLVETAAVPGFRPDEPILIRRSAKQWLALFRNNGPKRVLYSSTSDDNGRSWTTPVPTNIPSAPSKVYGLVLKNKAVALILNANPAVGRRDLHIALSRDGEHFTALAQLDVPSPPPASPPLPRIARKLRSGVAGLQYPHALEHDDHLHLVLSRGKVQIETFKVAVADLMALPDL